MMGMGGNPWNAMKGKNEKTKEKIPHWLPSHPPVYKMEADCFLVSEKTENKPDLPLVGEGSYPNGAKNTGLGAVWVLNDKWYELYTCEIPRSSAKADLR